MFEVCVVKWLLEIFTLWPRLLNFNPEFFFFNLTSEHFIHWILKTRIQFLRWHYRKHEKTRVKAIQLLYLLFFYTFFFLFKIEVYYIQCCITKWISSIYTHIPSLLALPSPHPHPCIHLGHTFEKLYIGGVFFIPHFSGSVMPFLEKREGLKGTGAEVINSQTRLLMNLRRKGGLRNFCPDGLGMNLLLRRLQILRCTWESECWWCLWESWGRWITGRFEDVIRRYIGLVSSDWYYNPAENTL